MISGVIEINETNFHHEVLAAGGPVLVQFWSGASEVSKTMAEMVQSVAEQDAMSVKVARVNVESQAGLAEQYGVRTVPTVLIFNEGGLRDEIVGRTSEQEVRDKLERFK